MIDNSFFLESRTLPMKITLNGKKKLKRKEILLHSNLNTLSNRSLLSLLALSSTYPRGDRHKYL